MAVQNKVSSSTSHRKKDFSYRAYRDALRDIQREEDLFPLALDSVLHLADKTLF
jgi:hypothetical protein